MVQDRTREFLNSLDRTAGQTNIKSYMIYRVVPFPVTLNDP